MKTVITEANSGDIPEIEQFLDTHPAATAYHKMQWLLAIKQSYHFDFVYLLARSGAQIVGVLPICLFNSITGKQTFCSLPFCDVGGPIAHSAVAQQALIDHATEKMQKLNCQGFELRQRATSPMDDNQMTGRKVSMLLELPKSADLLMKSFKSKLRSQVRKAEKNGLEFNCVLDDSSIADFYYVYSRNMHSLGSPPHAKQWFYQVVKHYKNNSLVGRVTFNKQIVGAGILLFNGNNVCIPWASTLREYNHLAPNMLLYWNLLKASCDRGATLFDFGRSTYDEGTFKFKQQWGAKPVLLDWQYLDSQARPVAQNASENTKTRQLVVSAWKKIPLPLANSIGPRLRRHISL